ncbi:hypothetical protein [Lysinibacillus telephonicus]|uniref:hypothetical protein n=1 Tax=Lysinibacillus telephonicus TaxID=1714840 RepID=UPI00163AC3A5
MKKSNVIYNLIGAIVCFILFVISMFYSEQVSMFILLGIVGLSGFSYFIYKLVLSVQ